MVGQLSEGPGIGKEREKTYRQVKINPMKVVPNVSPMFTARKAESDILIQSSRAVCVRIGVEEMMI